MERRDESGVCLCNSVVTSGSAGIWDPVKQKDLQVNRMGAVGRWGQPRWEKEKHQGCLRSTVPRSSITFFFCVFQAVVEDLWKFLREFKRLYLIETFEEFLFK